MQANLIREKFLKFFEANKHTIVSSSSLVPENDPTLLFANAGMNQFKDIFLGKEVRSYKRATSCQKVVRAGGKHNDLENVGRTSRHHTFFEMLGNFSFGDYFKKDAITFAWNFLTKELGLKEDYLFVTVYEEDDEAMNLWKEVAGLDEKKIFRRGKKDNFWQMGDTGPCGPCSEIFIDQTLYFGKPTGCKRPECDLDCDCDRHLEIWNLVFMQYNRDENGNLTPLPKPSIDTGMGLERIAAIMQKKESNYETDLIMPIMEHVASMLEIKYGDNADKDTSMRIIADHSRSTTFLIADGVLPGNEKRGYTLRKIMRRALRHGKMLGFEESFFYKVCGFVVDFMKGHYLELADKKEYIMQMIKQEEDGFSKTLSQGMKIIDELLEKYSADKLILGEDIFKLYDTYGFPIDLLEDIAFENGYKLDTNGFDACMARQQEMAKAASLGIKAGNIADIFKRLAGETVSEFAGYVSLNSSSNVIHLIKDDAKVKELKKGDKGFIVLDITTCYAESGGEVGDTGFIELDGGKFRVENTFKINDMILHSGTMLEGSISEGAKVRVHTDEEERKLIEANHTATHLLHKALRLVVGEQVRQAGSLVASDKLRFDFTSQRGLTVEELDRVEAKVNEVIFANIPVHKRIESREQAIKSGATALFGEKYGEEVRVVQIADYSTELCGGCHVDNTSNIGLFKILSESSISGGTRRIEAVTNKTAVHYLAEKDTLVKSPDSW